MMPLSQLSGQAEPKGLWSTSYSAGQSSQDCGKYRLDDNGFCVANDSRNGLELGVKFQTSRELVITGVRIYRVDTDAVSASLWNPTGHDLPRVTSRRAPATDGKT